MIVRMIDRSTVRTEQAVRAARRLSPPRPRDAGSKRDAECAAVRALLRAGRP
jgi:hypothetical protein